MNKRRMAVGAAITIVVGVLGGSAQAGGRIQNPADGHEICTPVPVSAGGVTVLGKRVPKISDLVVCSATDTKAGVVPRIIDQPQCGNPCFTVELRDVDVAVDLKVKISYRVEDGAPTVIEYDPQPVGVTPNTGRMCLVGYGTPDPCTDRITTPEDLSAAARKAGRVTLSWGASQDTGGQGLVGYEVWRSETGEEGTFSLVATAPEPSHLDRGLRKGQLAYYYVVAIDGDGNRSLASNVATVKAR